MRELPTRLRYLCGLMSFLFLFAASSPAQQSSSSTAPVRLTLADAIQRARHNSVVYQAALTDAGLAQEDKKQAVTALLPSVNYNNSVTSTQGNGTPGQVKFIANNAIHEYISQGNVHESLDLAGIAGARKASANASVAKARAEIASRGLIVTVVQSYYAVAAAKNKVEAAKKAADEGDRFLKLTGELERGGEVAHSDVIKAELQANDRKRQLQEANLAFLNARLDLAVLVFPNFNDNYELAEDLHAAIELPTSAEVESRAARDNPDIKAALETVHAADHGVSAARAGYLPSLGFDYFYGIDAPRFATRTNGLSNLGSSAVATLNIPVWNWGATQSRVKQAQLQRDQAKRELSLTQKKLLASLKSLYAEAQTAADELTSLQRSADLGAESLRLITLRYKNGESTVLEVVDAQNTATATDSAYQDGAVRYRVALANLQTLTGALTTP
ncbi:MAG: TolC family protein [Acidobacteria bacterium]|nr:TolC family protein [Acidobacteriota bacterium]MBS1866557.1 TolC family protein [Acidobacteriota bacterium]